MRYYDYNPENASELTLKIDAELKNLDAEKTVLEAVKDFTYSGNVFNRRYETQLHKYLGDKFGRVKLDAPNYRGEDSYNKVSAYMHEQSNYDGVKRYTVNVSYTGYKVGRNFETKTAQIVRSHGDKYQIYTAHNAEEVTEQVTKRLESIEETKKTLTETRKNVAKLIAEHNKVRQALEDFNNKIPYTLSEELRIG